MLVARVAMGQSMPGPMAIDHDKITSCDDCHKKIADGPELDDAKCVKCHANAAKGFHVKAGFAGKQCKSCHREHQGEQFDLMGWTSIPNGRDHFDHTLTGWPLEGQHKLETCLDCHTTKDRQKLPTFTSHKDHECSSCHDKKQPHKMVRPHLLACDRCHTVSAWKPVAIRNFDHSDRAQAGMPLLGSHKDVACTKCHPQAAFKLPFPKPDSCGNAGCHASPHDGHLFSLKKCETCHTPTRKTMKEVLFRHQEETRFELGPAHDQLACYRCHTKAMAEAKPSPGCESCHAQKSHHGSRFKQFGTPPKCGICHQETPTWDPLRFDHAANTKFPLGYKHADVTCRTCHPGSGPANFGAVGTGCMDCHTHQNAHDKQFKDNQCTQAGCHLHAGDRNTSKTIVHGSPQEAAHGINGTFPLVKKHASVGCAKCHNGRTQAGKMSFGHVSTNCSDNACHEDSLHKGSLGTKCTGCHVSGIWDALKFDHQADPFPTGDAAFALKGAHKDNKCESCHPKKQYAGTPRTCAAAGCHADDDAHKGRLGTQCEKCHQETGNNIFNHNTMSAFRLDGEHLKVKCADCHPSVTFKPRPVDCFGCHPEPAVHKGQYGTLCGQCHDTKTWRDIKPLHDVGDFSLKGAHDNIACERCHRDDRPLAGSGNLCINCHRQDDVHNNSLSPRCGECHTQWSFAPARFDHSKVGCTLTGLHRTISCFDCHRSGNFAGLAPNCVSCHHDDALRAQNVSTGAAGNTHNIQTNCAQCHSPNTWLGAPSNKFGRDSVCR